MKNELKQYVQSTMDINVATKFIGGTDLNNLLMFLENTALDARYEISKESVYSSDGDGNCTVNQTWLIKAISPVTHFIHGVVGDEPGRIRLRRVYDRTNGKNLEYLTTIAENNHVRFVFFLSKMLQVGEVVCLEIEYDAESYLKHLFTRGKESIFQRPNTRRAVLYRRRKDTFVFPENDTTKGIAVDISGLPDSSKVKRAVESGKLILSIETNWKRPSMSGYSYELTLKP